jgi:hypothetical protein
MQAGQDWDRVVIKPKASSGGKKAEAGAGGASTEKKCKYFQHPPSNYPCLAL